MALLPQNKIFVNNAYFWNFSSSMKKKKTPPQSVLNVVFSSREFEVQGAQSFFPEPEWPI